MIPQGYPRQPIRRQRRHFNKEAAPGLSIYTLIGTVTGCIALTISFGSLYYNEKSHTDTSGAQIISEAYATFYDLNKKQADNPSLSHMFVVPDDYLATAALVQQSTRHLTQEARAEYLLREKGIAFYIFTVFEATLFQYNHAVEVGDHPRAAFLRAVLDYFTGRLLRNPRLLYYWDRNGLNVSQYYESSTKEYYDIHVPHDTSAPLRYGEDSVGPYRVSDAH